MDEGRPQERQYPLWLTTVARDICASLSDSLTVSYVFEFSIIERLRISSKENKHKQHNSR